MLEQHIFFELVNGFREWFIAHREEIEKEFAIVAPLLNAPRKEGVVWEDMDLMDYALETFNDREE
jgi:hypothetical protein